ncbi:uncharacterized protein LOC125236689 [Leguminivora glycinivorella]|uniref:uncharacterized protein LOC125236442 n=1 Tax=Leguminivora glycinivorella TaxID=1035111 RepID=UPI00200C951F|nr:uncharacterized protein LOC125236442 [Leguminivora glycinivorella]XP_047999559.1 uncharacterized protein LOC125236689 [Leguminivora glycinivorella]
MPASKDSHSKYSSNHSYSNNGMTLSAKVYHPATNLMPLTPPHSPTGVAPSFNSKTTHSWSRQNSYNNGKQS